MVNNSRADWMFLGVADDLTANTTNPIHPVTLTPSATKAVTTTGPYIPTSAVTYKLTFGVSSSSPATLMANPVVVDLLPLNVNYVSYLYNASGSGLPAPTLEQVADFGGTGRTLLRWRFTGTMNRGKKAFITVNTTLAAGTPEGSLSNTFGVTVDNMPMNGGTADTQDLDGDGQTTDKLITATTSIAIAQLIGLDSQKRVKGELDASYSVYPSYGHTVPNGLVSYRLSIINRGNILINNVRVVDILPFVGDTGVQDTRARGSLWRPILVSPIPAQAGVSIYYSISSNPCRPEIVSTGPAGCTAANWSLTPPSKLDTVRSIRFDFSGTMSPGKVFTFEWTMRAPASGADESVAWNSFAFTSTNALTGVPLRPAEPNKVGIMLDTTPLPSLITIKKYTNTFDADDFPGPYIPLTDTVTWTYDVTNMGQTRLANIVVTDDVEGTITCPATALNPGEEMTCTLVSLDLPQLGQYTNVASVTSVAVDASDVPLDFDPVAPGTQLIQPTAYDPSHYYGYDPGTARLGDYAWIDLDYNGVQDAGEPPLGGVTVRLLNEAGNPVDEPAKAGTQDYVTTTDGSGFYAFVNLPAGTYQVQFDLPSAYSVTQANATDDALDSDLDPATNRTGLYTLAVDENNQTVDAGFIARATLGDQLWMDANGSGIQDSSEMTAPALLLGLQVDLMDATGTTTVATTYTDSAGNYIFNDLFPGSYVVRFPAPPTGYLWTTPYAGSADADSDANVVTNLSGVITLQAGEINSSVDAGLVAPASIGDQVWADNNLNGVQDNSESGVAGVTVRLLNSGGTQATDDTGALIPDTTTDATGVYTFANLRSGQYEVRFTLPAGYIFTTLDAAIDTVDSDAIVSGANIGRTVLTTLSAAEADTSWDAGLVKLASIGDLVWRDANNNGQQDVGESGVNGVTVTLLDSTGTPVTSDALGNAIAPITTPASGAYSFDNLDPRQTYIVQFERLTTDVFATANSGADATDSDAVPSGTLPAGIGRSGTITLTAGAADTSVDAGMVVAAAIGNAVFYDNDNSGTQTAGDTPVPAVTVRLLDSAGVQSLDERGNVIPDQTTDVNGLYHFTGLLPGTYGLAFFTLPTDYTFAQIDVGADDAVDSDPNRFTGLTPTTLLDVGEDDTTWDAGLVQAAALGDLVWVDVNANGQQDAGETGLSGVTVNLLDGTGAAVDNPNTPAVDSYSMTTDSNGNYLFDGLPPNLTYRVQFIRSGNYVFAPANSGADATDSDGQLSGQTTVASVMTVDITTLIPNASDLTWDQGMLLPSGLGNFVWRDGNDDGLQTAAEPGISGATVNLLDSTGTPVDDPNTTGTQNYTLDSNAAGGYLFTNLYPGTYILEFITPTGCKRADYLVGAGANAATDSDMQISGADAGRTPAITLAYDSTDLTWDAGFVPLATLGDFVWRDNNDNGVQDAGEPGISGATVNLLDSTGTTVTTDGMGNAINPVTTPASGAYTFTDLDPDLDYIVQFTLPTPATGVAGYTFSPQNAGADTADSDADFVTGRTAVIALNPGQTDNTQDAGMTPLAQIGDYVWNDLNGDGAQGGAGETGVDGVVVKLYLASDLTTALYTTTTAANPVGGAAGYYQFLNLDAGTYVVEFTLPNDYIFTRQDAATATDTTDSDANRFSGQTGSYTLTWGETNQTADAGIVQPASLGDFVWYDTNDNGLQDVGESGQNGIVVRLLDTTNAAVDNPNTVAVNDAYVVTTANDPISGLPGYYVFSDLIPGDYRVQFDLSASTLPFASTNYVLSRQNQGANDAADSDPDRATGITATVHVNANQYDQTTDAGLLLRGSSLGDRVWIDLNNNGVQDAGEDGLNGVTVTLLNGTGGTDIDPITAGTQTLSSTTNATGIYSFTNLVPGDYLVAFTLPTGYIFTQQDAAAATDATDSDVVRLGATQGRTIATTLIPGESDTTWDAGVLQPATLGDLVWLDADDDGVKDSGESGIYNVSVRLLDSTGTAVNNPNNATPTAYETTTSTAGAYSFTGLFPGSYIVEFVLLDANTVFARQNQGADDTLDSDADRLTGRTGTYTLIANQTNSTADAGMMTRASLGNLVWDDVNGNGVQDGGESGVDGVTVTLLNETGGTDIDAITAGTQTLSTTTAGGGAYSFTNLVPGDYLVEFSLPAGYVFTTADAVAGTDATDSDANRFTKRTISTTLIAGENDTTWDAGVVKPAALGDFVWLDADDDGMQDAGEPGISGVTVRLLDSTGTAVNNPNNATPTAYVTTTSAAGAYSFTGLIPGDYRVEYVLPGATYAFAQQDAAADTADSDADRVTGRTATYTLIADQTDTSADAGMVQRASLGDRVWNDVDGDGTQDAGETGVNGVTVTLLNGTGGTDIDPITAGTQTLSTTTAGGGAYNFSNLVPGTYIVQVTLPTDYIFTRQDTAADSADSDVERLTGLTGTYRLLSNQTDTSADAGILQNASLGNLMWDDLDGDGAQDAGETGIRGVTVTLYDGTGTQADNPNTAIADTYVVTTGAGGDYLFDHLLPGDYYMVFTLPTGYMFTAQDAATDATDSDVVRLGATQGKTITTSLISGEDDATWDAGVLKPATLGNFVWTDSNDNGLQDVGETGVDGVTVRLLNGSGTAVNDPKLETPTAYEVTTASGGAYSFTGLFPGNYIVEFVLPDANTVFARLNQGADTAVDSDANRVTGRTVVYTLTADQTDDSADAGLLQRASLGNFVWNDADGNGVQDGGETGVDGVQVTLLNGAGGTDIDAITAGTQTLSTTTAGGAYSFTKLVPGTYIVQVTLPASYIFTRQDATTDTDDSDVDRFTGRTIVTTLISGENDTTWDTGVLKLATLGDLVWLDNDDDGLQDAGEPGVSGMTVNLLDGAGNPVNDPNSATPTAYSVTTDANGHYAFTGLFPGNYIAEFVLINANYTFARQNQGADTAVDSDADRTTGRTGVVTLVADQTDTSADSGVLARASLGNRVWDDVDGDGVQDAGESGLGGVTVTLYNSADVQVGLPKATDGTGAYLFDNLVPGDYYVVFTLPAGYMFTVKDAATATDLTDSDAVRLGATQGRTLLTTLISGEADDSWDAGVLKPATLGNFVWADSDDDGVQDAGETGVNGVTVRLLDSSGAAVNDPAQITPTAYEVTTVSGGAYSFSGLFPGNYIVEFVLPDANTVFARLNQGADTAVDSDADRLTGHTGVYTLTADQTDNSADVGLLQRASLGNFVWNDADENGTQNGGETGVDGVQVTLLNGAGGTDIDAITAGTQTLSTTTAAGGAYIFTNLVPGAYIVQVTLPAGYIFTRQDAATDTTDSDVDRFTGSTIATTLISGENDTTWDTGVLKPAALGNFVWLDSDDDGLQDAGEAAVSGIAVHLLDSTGAAVDDPNKAAPTAYSVTTDANGAYSFTGLFPGSYRVEFVLPDANTVFARLNQGADTAADSDADRTTGRTGVYTLVADQTDNSADAGLMTLASIGNFVWLDLNDNGLQDGGEPSLKDVTIFLTDENAVTTSTTSATDGSYSFTNLVPGNYSLQFVLPSNQYEFSDTDQGANDALDSDADTVTGNTATTHLISDETDRTWDAGIVPLASIGDRVWLDADNDGIQDAGEADFANVTVNLLNASGTVLQTMQTDANGNYLFDLLTPADYAIEVLLPDVIYQFSPQDQGAANGSDSDVNIVSGRTVVTTLSPDEHDLSWDAGLVLLSSVGDYVWVDMNNDGVQDGGETGLTGVTVRLLDAGGATVATTTTGANGDYLFDLVSPDDYRVEFVLPLHYQFSLPDMGGNDATDSDANRTTGRTVLFTLPPDTKEATRDAGLVPLSSIGNHVWRDNDGNGLQDGGETGLVGVTMHLLDGTVILTTTTDTNGDYLFSDLPPGDYAIEVVTPDNFMIAPQNQSADTTVDSDVDPTTGRSAYTTLLPDEADLSWDVGLPPLGSIGDLVWADVDGDGMQDAGEPGLAGISLELLANDIPYAQTTTDADGHYLFDNLPPGDYRLVVIPPASYAVSPSNASLETTDSDLDEITDSTPVIPMDYGLIDLGWDVGLVPLGSIGDLVWDDANGNSVLDGGESGIPNVTLTLTLPDTTTLTTQTDRNGKYAFPNLLTGKYTVTVDVGTLPAGMEATYDLAPPFDSSAEYMLGIGEQADVLDFGYQTPSPIGIQGGTSTEASTTPPPQEGSAPPGNTGCVSACVDWQLYHSNQTGDWEIFRLDADGTSTNLSQGGAADDMAPTRSPDAQWIVFSSNRDGNWELYLAAADGDDSSSNRLTYNTIANDTDPVWGPNSSVVYETTRDGNWELYLLDMATGAERRLTDDPATDINAYWSEDGTKIVFQSDRSGLWQLYELDLTTNQTTLLSDGVANDVDAQYSSDDQRILFRSYRDGAKSTLYIMNADGSGLIRISDVRGDATNPSGSSDDRLIAYQSALDGDLDIYVYEVGTGITRKLTDNAVADYAPTWLCDSSTVIFTSDVDGNPNLFDADALSINAPLDVPTEAQRLTTAPEADIYPENAHREENASREGQLPGVNLGDQTNFLLPDVSVTVVDPSVDTGEAWEPLAVCPVQPQ